MTTLLSIALSLCLIVSASAQTNQPETLPRPIVLTGVLSSELVTNWTTVSTTYTVYPAGSLVFSPPTDHQVGTVVSNLVATVDWANGFHAVTLESTVVATVERDVPGSSLIDCDAASKN